MSPGGLFLLGASHRTAPIAVRERLALDDAAQAALAAQIAEIAGMRECAILGTCNRLEIYGVAADREAAARVQEAFCLRRGLDVREFETFRLALEGRDVVQHLFEVASGLDSQMLGETEIFGQVKDAYAAAQARGLAGPVLNRVFQKAFQAAKHVRSETAITSGQVSVANVAVELAASIFGSLDGVRILVVGAGEIGEKTARAFQSRGAATLAIASRSGERALELAGALSAVAVPFDQLESRLGDYDVVVCSTAAPHTVVSAAAARAAMRRRPSRPLFFIDLALPRDVEPAVAELVNVFRYDLDDLGRIAAQNLAAREGEIERGRAILRARAEALWGKVEPLLPGGAAPIVSRPAWPSAGPA